MTPSAPPPSPDPGYCNDASIQMGQEVETGSNGDQWLANKGTKRGWAALKSGQNPICRYKLMTEVQFCTDRRDMPFPALALGSLGLHPGI